MDANELHCDRTLFTAPFAAATYVSLASGSMVDFAKEMFAAGKFITEGTRPGVYGELVDALIAAYATASPEETRRLELRYTGDDRASLRAQARQVVVEAAAAVHGQPGAEGYRQWLMAAARIAALAATAGIFGSGARGEIDIHEQAAIEELAAILLTGRNPQRAT